jgi:hypothetical protein
MVRQQFESQNPSIPKSDNHFLFYDGVVISNDDPLNLWRLKVRIPELNDQILSDDSIPFAYPLLSKDIGFLPVEGEAVKIILRNKDSPLSFRYWISRTYSDFSKIDSVEALPLAQIGTLNSPLKRQNNSGNKVDAGDVYPNKEFAEKRNTMLGKDQSDFFISKYGLFARTGKKNDDGLKNNKNMGLFAIIQNQTNKDTFTILHSDKILLGSNSASGGNIIPLDTENYDSGDQTLEKRLEEAYNRAYSSVRGEPLLDFLKLLKEAILFHSHKYHNLPASMENEAIIELKNFETNKILNKNIKLN